MLTAVLVILAFAFIGYAIYTFYSGTTGSVPARIWASVLAAATALAAIVSAWFHSGGTP